MQEMERLGPRSLFGCIGSEPARKRPRVSVNLIAGGIPDTTTWTKPSYFGRTIA
jgi:hypothetical protein